MVLRQLPECLNSILRHQAEISGSFRDPGFPQAIDGPIESLAGYLLEEESAATTIEALGMHDFIARFKQAEHFRNQCWRMFPIAVHHDDYIRTTDVKSGTDRGLVAKIPREMYGVNPGIGRN